MKQLRPVAELGCSGKGAEIKITITIYQEKKKHSNDSIENLKLTNYDKNITLMEEANNIARLREVEGRSKDVYGTM